LAKVKEHELCNTCRLNYRGVVSVNIEIKSKKMKIERLSLQGIKNVLSRAELKKIMAGSGTGGCTNMGLAIPCCQCATGIECCPWVYVPNSPPIPYECDCYCKAEGYPLGGLNDCPNNIPACC
jgi:hypothetical protein